MLPDINLWGLASIVVALEACLFAFFLWKTAVPTPVTRRFTFLLLIEVVTLLTSNAGIVLLFNFQLSEQTNFITDILHHVGDVLMLILYPIFVAHALPLKSLKLVTSVAGRITLWTLGSIFFVWSILGHLGVITPVTDPDMLLYLAMCIMFVAIFIISLVGLKTARTKLAREKALAFVAAFGIRDLAWASVYLAAATGWIEGRDTLFNLIYVGSTLLYIPIVAYGILKVQLLDIEIRLQSTIRNTVLASTFVAVFYVISEGTNALIENQLGDVAGFVACALLAIFLAPLHRWAERFAAKLVNADTGTPDYAENRGLQIYTAAVDEAMAYGEIHPGQIALLDRLRDTLQISENDARKIELDFQFNRAAVAT